MSSSNEIVSSGLIYHIDPYNKNCYVPFITNSSGSEITKNTKLINFVDKQESSVGNYFSYRNGVIRMNDIDPFLIRGSNTSGFLQTSLLKNIQTVSMWIYLHGPKPTRMSSTTVTSDEETLMDGRRIVRTLPYVMPAPGRPYTNTITASAFSSIERGDYYATASSFKSELANSPRNAFNLNGIDYWQSEGNKYSGPISASQQICNYIGTAKTSFKTSVSSSTVSDYNGEWIQLQVPNPVKISGFTLRATDFDTPPQAPNSFSLFGSTDGVTFVKLYENLNQTFLPNQTLTFWLWASVNDYFTYFRLAINKIQGSIGGYVNITDLGLFYEFPQNEDTLYNSWFIIRFTPNSSGNVTSSLIRSTYWDSQSSSAANLYVDGGPIRPISLENIEVYDRWRHLTFVVNSPADVTSRMMFFANNNKALGTNCSFGPITIYNRVLTEAENLQNYNFYKNRFIDDITSALPTSMFEVLPTFPQPSTTSSSLLMSSSPPISSCPIIPSCPSSPFPSSTSPEVSEDKFKVNTLAIILIVVTSVLLLVVVGMFFAKSKGKNTPRTFPPYYQPPPYPPAPY